MSDGMKFPLEQSMADERSQFIAAVARLKHVKADVYLKDETFAALLALNNLITMARLLQEGTPQ